MSPSSTIPTGLTGTVTMTVAEADTAMMVGSGDVPVLATPRIVALAEQAACAAVVNHLEEGSTTVGSRVELDHLRPTAIGATVEATVTLEEVDGRRLEFSVSVREDDDEVARGRHRRVVVPRADFS